MIRTPVIWGVGLTGSLLLHLLAAGFLLWTIDPEPVAEQPVPETRMQLSAHQVRQSDAVEARPDADIAQAQDASGPQLDQGVIRQTAALAAEPETNRLAALDDAAESVRPLDAAPDALIEVSETSNPIEAANITTAAVTASSLPLTTLSTGPAPTQAIALTRPNSQTAQAVETQAVALSQTIPDVPRAKASDVFSSSGDEPIDPVSLAAFQSFMQPGDAAEGAQDVRDGIDGLLSQVPCSRLQVQFRPESNTLELIGHIPEDGLRAPVLSALQAQMGENIQVADNLLVLPRPQCGALSGIADVGLPQSTDQITNPLLVGEDVHARAFRYTEGQQLVLDLTGADYDAYIYVDYFDADGQVIHLSPNDTVPLVLTPAKTALQIGAQNQGDPGLFITIGPPYGQEIAVAFAASRPLFDEARPLTEPADAYLAFLKDRVSAARAQDPDFKGEWVYFFITTAAQ
ncbi:hypothetical protein RA28_07965 [Ruegeria sp. ANG-S4]|uniref:DUF4384 domain-containing protein n=1 Tax=Ruegeria sp. ANG-S4 TaxID=1577904 RepID=UPI00057C8BE2|nr:DUF4384 domain-containing protein [Ruegeria sp. ANG-S4]KIC45645.1 hypothetical protein RA28_07965 [Ruegeria sp. ANG-S4]